MSGRVRSNILLKDHVDHSLNECMAMILVWVLLEGAQRYCLSPSHLWYGSLSFGLAWLWRSPPGYSLAQWGGLFIVSFLVWFDQGMGLVHAGLLAILFYISQQISWRKSPRKITLLLQIAALVILLSVLQLGFNFAWETWQKSPIIFPKSLAFLLAALMQQSVGMLISLTFYYFCLIPLLKILVSGAEKLPHIFLHSSLSSAPMHLALLSCLAGLAWVWRVLGLDYAIDSRWLLIFGLLLSGCSGLYGAITATYISYVLTLSAPSENSLSASEQILTICGGGLFCAVFAMVVHREPDELAEKSRSLSQCSQLQRIKIQTLEQTNICLSQQMEAWQRIVLRSIQELRTHLTPVVLSSKLMEEKSRFDSAMSMRILQSSIKKQMIVMQDLQDMMQMVNDSNVHNRDHADLMSIMQSASAAVADL
ncbi:MAG: hypothetical protein NTX25_12545, partial [Proteobacteria bacterium]|nr:hypothetical protein [Pseudomonadota bacterium]